MMHSFLPDAFVCANDPTHTQTLDAAVTREYTSATCEEDGAFLLRNSNNYEAENTSESVYMHYRLQPAHYYSDARVVVSGRWTTEAPSCYTMRNTFPLLLLHLKNYTSQNSGRIFA